MIHQLARPWVLCLSVVVLFAGCAGTNQRWQAWKTDVVDTAKAFSGTGEYLGASTQSRDIERSLQAHRQ